MPQNLLITYQDIRRESDIPAREIDIFFGPPGELRVLDAQILIQPGEFKTVRIGRSYSVPPGYAITAALRQQLISKGLSITHFDVAHGVLFIANHSSVGLFRELRKGDPVADIVVTKLESVTFTEVPRALETSATGI